MSLSARLSGQTTESDLSDIWQGAPPSASDGWAAGFRIDRKLTRLGVAHPVDPQLRVQLPQRARQRRDVGGAGFGNAIEVIRPASAPNARAEIPPTTR